MRSLIVIVVLASSATSAFAQAATGPTETSPWDATAVVAAFAARPSDQSDSGRVYDQWSNSGAAGVVVGRHLSPHLKVELDLSAAGEGRRWVQRFVSVPGSAAAYPVGAEQFTSVRAFSASLVRQFFENQWAHPFVQAGVAVEAERVRDRTFPQQVYIGGSRPENLVVLTPGGESGPVTTTRVRLLLGVGTKVYVTPRVFLRTDARFALDGAVRSLAMRAGAGVDF